MAPRSIVLSMTDFTHPFVRRASPRYPAASIGMPAADSHAGRLGTQRQTQFPRYLEIDRRGTGARIQDEAVRSVAVQHSSQYDLVVNKIEWYFQAGARGEYGQEPPGNEKGADVQPHNFDCEAGLFPCPAWLRVRKPLCL